MHAVSDIWRTPCMSKQDERPNCEYGGTIAGVSLLTEQSAFITKKVSQVDENASCLHACGFGHL